MKLSKTQKLVVLGVLIVIVLLLSQLLSIVDLTGYIPGNYGKYYKGSTVYWRIKLDPSVGSEIQRQIIAGSGACDNNVVSIQYTTFLACPDNSNNIQRYNGISSMYCKELDDGLVLNGNPSGVIPNPYNYDSCAIYDGEYSIRNYADGKYYYSKKVHAVSRIDVLNSLCTVGQKMCINNAEYVCTELGWPPTATRVCPTGRCASSTQCEAQCSSGQILCVGTNYYRTCIDNSWSSSLTYISDPTKRCDNGAIVNVCNYNRVCEFALGETSSTCSDCVVTTPCNGNGICDGSETFEKCPSECKPACSAQMSTCSVTTQCCDGLTCYNALCRANTEFKTCWDGSIKLKNEVCPAGCGDGICDSGENWKSCLQDCPRPTIQCPDKTTVLEGETCPAPKIQCCDGTYREACPADLCVKPPVCGDGVCAAGEICPVDCIINRSNTSLPSYGDNRSSYTIVCNFNNICEPAAGEDSTCSDCRGVLTDNTIIYTIISAVVLFAIVYFVVTKKK